MVEWFGSLTALQWYGLLAPLVLAGLAGIYAVWITHGSDRRYAESCAARRQRLTFIAAHVVGDAEAEAWMQTPQPMLGGRLPNSMVDSDISVDKAERLLLAMAQGLPGLASAST
jgi:hypothetical protein